MRTSVAALADCDAVALASAAGDTDASEVAPPAPQAASAALPAVAAIAPRNTRRVITEGVDADAESWGMDMVRPFRRARLQRRRKAANCGT